MSEIKSDIETEIKLTDSQQKQLAAVLERMSELQGMYRRADALRFTIAKDMRDVFPKGGAVANLDGDAQMIAWCTQNMIVDGKKCTNIHARYWLAYSIALQVFKDADKIRSAGGRGAVEMISSLPREEQVKIFIRAKEESKPILEVWRERGHDDSTRVKVTPALDAKALAEFLEEKKISLPHHIKVIVERYLRRAKSRASA